MGLILGDFRRRNWGGSEGSEFRNIERKGSWRKEVIGKV
jgi:hypothetical protein